MASTVGDLLLQRSGVIGLRRAFAYPGGRSNGCHRRDGRKPLSTPASADGSRPQRHA